MPFMAISRRRALAGFLAAGGSTVLAACGSTPTPQTVEKAVTRIVEGTPQVTVETVVVTEVQTQVVEKIVEVTATGPEPAALRFRSFISAATSPLDGEWYDWLNENYGADSGGSTIEFEYVTWGPEYVQKLLADSAAGSPPDILDSSIVWARDFSDRGVLLELNDYLDQVPLLALDQFVGDATNTYASKDGVRYGVSYWGPDAAVIAVNSTLLGEAGYDPKGTDIKTWDDFAAAAKAMTKTEGDEVTTAGYMVGSMSGIETFASWLHSDGGAMHDDAITKPAFNDSKGADVLQWHLDLLNTDKVSMPISPERQDEALFMQGKVGFLYWGTWAPTYIAGNAEEGFEYNLILMPQGPQGSAPAAITWSNMMVIPKQAAHPAQAFDLAKYIATPPNIITRFEIADRATPHKALFESEAWAKKVEELPAMAIVPEAAAIGGIYPFFPLFTEANDVIGVEFEKVMLGQQSVAEGLTAAETAVNEVIARRQSEL